MDFKPFQAPDSDYNSLNTGLSTEGGVTAKGFVEGVNTYLGHLFKVVGGRMGDVIDAIDGEARERITVLEETVAAMQIKLDAMSPNASAPSISGLPPIVHEPPIEPPAQPATEAPALTVGGA